MQFGAGKAEKAAEQQNLRSEWTRDEAGRCSLAAAGPKIWRELEGRNEMRLNALLGESQKRQIATRQGKREQEKEKKKEKRKAMKMEMTKEKTANISTSSAAPLVHLTDPSSIHTTITKCSHSSPQLV